MIKKLSCFLCGLLVVLTLQSCTEDLNFDQFDELQIQPVIEGSILYVEAPEDAINSALQANFYTQNFNFDGFSDAFFAERVLDGIVTYLVENTTSKALEISVYFLDEDGNILDVEIFNIDPAPPIVPVLREIPYGGTGKSLEILKNTSELRVEANNLGDTTSTSSLEDPMVIIKSSGKFRLSIK